jgi:hypothetical protein
LITVSNRQRRLSDRKKERKEFIVYTVHKKFKKMEEIWENLPGTKERKEIEVKKEKRKSN